MKNSFERLVPRGPFSTERADAPPAATGASLYRMRTGQEIDAAVGADLKARTRELLAEVCLVMDEARDAGLVLTFAVGRNAAGAHEVQGVTVVKPL